jgi:hypothetical protein
MAAATDTNEIIIDPARCIYVKKDPNTSEIYFSNYYLKTLFKESFVNDSPMKINFSDGIFMNDEIIPLADKEKIPNTFTTDTLKIKKADLDILEYSKITYTPAAPAPDGTAVLDTKIDEMTILEKMKNANIFTNKAQLRQYLKYNGLWYQTQPTQHTFAQRANTNSLEKEEKEEAVAAGAAGGGKKTTTRRRGKTGYNKHRKSNRRR